MTTIKSICGKYAVDLIRNGGREDQIITIAAKYDGETPRGYDYWFTIGQYKSEKNAIRAAVRKMSAHNIKLDLG